jgi:hypothetical protein
LIVDWEIDWRVTICGIDDYSEIGRGNVTLGALSGSGLDITPMQSSITE